MHLVFQSNRVFAARVAALSALAPERTIDRGLHAVGINRAYLADREAFVPYGVVAGFIEHVARDLGDPCIGARVGATFLQRCPGRVGSYMLGAPTLGVALSRVARALPTIHSGASVQLASVDGCAAIRFECGLQSAWGSAHVEQGTISMLLELCRHYHGRDWTPVRVDLPHPQARQASGIDQLLRADVAPSEGPATILLPLRALDLRSPSLVSDLDTTLQPASTWKVAAKPPDTVFEAVLQATRMQLQKGDTSLQAVASRLGLEPRTLQRYLRNERSTFRDAWVAAVYTRAQELLTQSDLSVADVARDLGYKEVNSFRRAFQSWSQMTPNAYRRFHRYCPGTAHWKGPRQHQAQMTSPAGSQV